MIKSYSKKLLIIVLMQIIVLFAMSITAFATGVVLPTNLPDNQTTEEPSNPININASTTTAVTGVSLNKTSLSLAEGASETLVATVSPSDATTKTIRWSSNNTSVATVDASTGKVTAVKAGTATITVTTTDGLKTAICTVTVTAPAQGTTPGQQLGQYGENDIYIVTALIVVCGISAIFAYKKIREFNV